MPNLPDYISNKISDGHEGVGVPFGPGCQPIGLEQSSLFSRSGIPDAGKIATELKTEGGEQPGTAAIFRTHQTERPSLQPLAAVL